MRTAASIPKPAKVDVAIALAVDAWRRAGAVHDPACTGSPVVTAIRAQRPGRKFGIYRLAGAAHDGSDIIAKRCPRETWDIEHTRCTRDLDRPARAGAVFRVVAAVHWAAEQMRGGSIARDAGQMCWAAEFLTRILPELDR